MNDNLDKFLKVLRNFPEVTVKLLAKEAKIGERTVKIYLQQLKEAELIRRIGTNRKGYWEIITPSNDNILSKD
ncbi:MAG: hypothetical protein K2H60_04910 [Muribaculaceae bacterium]|nr:hypothetical protein [Muribaculaceae bacterium]